MERRRRSASETRREIELAILLESMPEGVLIVDAEGRILEGNSAAERFTRLSRAELRGMPVGRLAKLVSIQRQDAVPMEFPRDAAARALRGEHIHNERRTFRSLAENGERIEALVSANPIRDAEGEILGAVVVISDITELTQLQRRMSDTERHHALGQMAASLAHDFSNVLDAIDKAARLVDLRPDVPAEKRQQYLQLLHNAVHRGTEITGRLRQYLRDGAGDLAPVDARQVLDEAVELTRPLWQDTGIKVRRELKPVDNVQADAADLRRVFTNLIINSIESMPEGGELTVSCGQHRGTVHIQVADTGHGIPLGQQEKIFNPYFTTKAKGTGLGLSGAQRIVLSYGGNIRFQSEPGKGTRFIIELPTMEQREKAAQGGGRPVRQKSDGNGSEPNGNDGVPRAA